MSNKAVMYDASLYTPNNGDTVAYDSVTGKFIPVPFGSGSGGVTPITYSALLALTYSSNLVPGAFYEITDFRTAHYIQYSGPITGSGGIGGEEVNLGTIEPLIVQAVSYSELSVNASSSLYPDDKILYLISVADGEYDYASPSGRGCIIYREDTVNKVARDYDWRNVVFRRWETSPGSGDFYSFTPVIGAAYQDVSAFSSPSSCFNTYIKSPLNNPLEFIVDYTASGFPYQLDNTVFKDVSLVTDFTINFAFGNHFTTALSSPGQYSACLINACVNNTVAVEVFSANNIAGFINNYYVQTAIVTYFSGVDGFTNNTLSSFQGNTVTGYFYGNIGFVYLDNNINSAVGNNSHIVVNNDVPFITFNQCNEILDNTCGSAINGNNCVYVISNICQSVDQNLAYNINTNTVDNDIAYNIANDIDNNICSSITNNNIAFMSNNNITTAYSIVGNTGYNIDLNTNTGDIIYNAVTYLYNNSNAGIISYNKCSVLSQNSNVGTITENSCTAVYLNSNSGNIEDNSASISTNSTSGHISGNVGFTVSDNSGTIDVIVDNDVHSITNNSGNTPSISGNKGHSLKNNVFDSRFDKNTFHTFTSNTFGNSAGANIIEYHNFVDSIESSTVTPTADMSSSIKYTKSIWDIGTSQHYELTLTSGIISYTAIT